MSQKPNILMIMVDQQRYDCLGYSNAYPVKTPHIDQLAQEGLWFSNAYTPIPVCGPARQALLNGRRAEAIGALWNHSGGLKTPTLEPEEYTWSRAMQDSGYQTGYIGKWSESPTYDPTAYGYDQYVSLQEYEHFRNNKYPDVTYTNGFFGETDPLPVEDSKTHWTADQAVQMMEQYSQNEEPWHIRLNFEEPHLPCRPTQAFLDMYDAQEIPPWSNFNEEFTNKPYIQKQQLYSWKIEDYTWEDWAPIVARYYAIISQMDDAIGRVLAELEHLGMSDNTMVIFTADHGDMCGAHRMMDKHNVLYEDIVKVPLVIKWPEQIKRGQVCEEFVYNMLDLPPTILDVAGLPSQKFFHGRSLSPLLHGEQVTDWRQEAVSTYNGGQFGAYTQRMIRYKNWKYVWNTTDVDELYHLGNDPDELHNLIYDSAHAQHLKQLREKLYEVLKNEGDTLVNNEWIKYQLLHNAII